MAMNFVDLRHRHARLLDLRLRLHVRRLGAGRSRSTGRTSSTRCASFTLGGKPFDLLGYKGFFLTGAVNDATVLTLFLFQMVFMDTAATIPTGAMAERWKFSAFMVYGFFMSMIIYPVYGCWVWGGGWLADLGRQLRPGQRPRRLRRFERRAHDRRRHAPWPGRSILGPRIGKFNKDGIAQRHPRPQHRPWSCSAR